MLASIVVSATLLAVTFRLLAGPFDEVLAARVGAAIAVVGGPAIAAHLTNAGVAAVARAIGLEVALGAMAFGVSALLNTSIEFFLLGLATAWATGTAVALHAEGAAPLVGRLLVMLSIGPLLLVAAVWGVDFYVVGAVPAVVGLAALPPLGDLVGRYVANVGALAEDGRVERP